MCLFDFLVPFTSPSLIGRQKLTSDDIACTCVASAWRRLQPFATHRRQHKSADSNAQCYRSNLKRRKCNTQLSPRRRITRTRAIAQCTQHARIPPSARWQPPARAARCRAQWGQFSGFMRTAMSSHASQRAQASAPVLAAVCASAALPAAAKASAIAPLTGADSHSSVFTGATLRTYASLSSHSRCAHG